MLVENNPEESGFWLVIKAGKKGKRRIIMSQIDFLLVSVVLFFLRILSLGTENFIWRKNHV
jgi:hypothetical protein